MDEDSRHFEKLKRMAKQFRQAYYTKKWGTAKYLYATALHVAEFLELPPEQRRILFGDRQDEENPVEGLFDEKMVIKVHDECVMKLYQGYENESYRRYGQPPRYYPAPRYPVPGYPKPEEKE